MRGVLGYLFTSDSVDRQVDHRIYESDNTTEGLMHTTPLKNCLHVPISKRGTLSQIEQLYEIASEAQLH